MNQDFFQEQGKENQLSWFNKKRNKSVYFVKYLGYPWVIGASVTSKDAHVPCLSLTASFSGMAPFSPIAEVLPFCS